MVLDSYSVMRIPKYFKQIRVELIKPQAPIELIHESPNSVVIDCNWNFGIVSARIMTDIVIGKGKKNNIVVASSRYYNHRARLGYYMQRIAQLELLGFAVVKSSTHIHFVAPFGGIKRKLAINPLSYAIPTRNEPLILDMQPP